MPGAATRFRQPAAILLISCYELGHQPLGLAAPAGALRGAGYAPRLLDLSHEPLDPEAITQACFAGVCVPMHTALVMGVHVARRIRAANPGCHLCFYGLYAALNADFLLERLADSVIAGEISAALAEWIAALEAGSPAEVEGVSLPGRPRPPRLTRPGRILPERKALPPLASYVRLEHGGRLRRVGSVEATQGCKHHCLHCPIPPVYGGRFFAVPREAVLADIRQLVAAGAEHISFGDPDFLNGPGHAMAVIRAMRAEFPDLSYDFTAKIAHLLKHRRLLREFAASGCRFIVSAVESLSDRVLAHLAKGHTRADVAEALALTRETGIPLRPSLVPFTPWSTLEDYLELLEWVERENLIRHIEPIQFAIRLLVPPGSALLGTPQFEPYRTELDREGFTWRWRHPQPRMDALQAEVMRIVERATEGGDAPEVTFQAIRNATLSMAGFPEDAETSIPPPPKPPVPRLTEPWFC